MPFDPNGKYVVGTLSFNPKDYLIKVKGSSQPNYLEVKYRLVMLREMFPEAVHTTQIHSIDLEKGTAVVHATITLPNGAVGHGYKMEEKKDFNDYLEKAETGATGRALYAAGIGTQYSNVEYDYESESAKPFVGVDTPLKPLLKEDILSQLTRAADRIGADRLAERSQKMFKTAQSSKLNPEQLQELVAWATAQP